MDVRVELVNRMDVVAATLDLPRLGALARLNWQLIDAEVLQFSASRVAQVQGQNAAAQQQAQLAQRRQQLADARSNYVIGQAAVAINVDPSQYMSSPSAPVNPGADPRVHQLVLVHGMLSRAALLRGAPDPEISPLLAARAKEILLGQIDDGELVRLVIAASPPAQQPMLAMSAQVPGLAQQLFLPIVRGSAVWAVSLLRLSRLFPDARIAAPKSPPTPPAATPSESSDAPSTGAGGFADGLVPPDVRAALGNSLVFEDWRGDYAAALKLCAGYPDAIVGRALVLAASGQAAAAQRLLLALIESGASRTDTRAAALHVYRYAQRINGQLIPGGDGGSDEYLKRAQRTFVSLAQVHSPTPAARMDCEALAELANCLTLRTTTSIRGRRDDATRRATMGSSMQETFDDAARAAAKAPSPAGSRSPVWVALAAADLHHRDGDAKRAQEMIELARGAAGTDAHAHGEIALAVGHRAACASESPLTLGLCLEASPNADSSLDERIERVEWITPGDAAAAEASRAYDAAAAAFTRAGSPRGLAAVALARAGLAALVGDHRRAGALASEAEHGFAALGDEMGRRLARTHVAIAATGFGVAPDRDTIREVGAWAASDGSLSFGIGCARLLSRSGRRALYRDGDVERSLALHGLAYDLLSATPLDMLAAQALGDRANALRLANDFDALADTLARAASQLAGATLGDPPDLALRRAQVLQQAWEVANRRRDPDGLENIAQQIAAVLVQVDAVAGEDRSTALQLSRLLLTQMTRISPTVVALYRAVELDADPTGDAAAREAAWQVTIDLARGLPPSDGLLYEGLAEAARGDSAAASAAFQRLFDGQEPVTAAQQAVPDAPPLPNAGIVLARRDALALSCFLRAQDLPRARAAYDRLVARDPGWAAHADEPWNNWGNVGELHAAEGDPAAALVAYQAALEAVEARRHLLTEDSLKRGFVDTSPIHAMYVGAARAALGRDRSQAFELVERGRARALLELACDRRSTATAWRAYNAQRGLLDNQLALEIARPIPDDARIAALRARLVALEAARPSVPAATDPMATTRLADVAARLPADTVLLEYAFADDWLISWAITQAGMVTHRTVRIRTAELRRAALGFRTRCGATRDVTTAGRVLAALLLEPFAEVIRGAAHVVVVPTDALHVVPFHALPFATGVLLDVAAVSYAPSARLLDALGRGPLASGPLVVVGNPADMAFTDGDGSVQQLHALPGAGAEARRIAAVYPGSLPALVGPAATLDAVCAGLPAARSVHLATHAVLSARSPWLSTIALAGGASLDLSTLSSLELQADLVTLSACDTARGTIGKSDETLGFARGLIAAGARRTVVSLWPVDDVATCELMTVFYRELAAGRPVAQALRLAQLHVRDLPVEAITALVAGLVADDQALAAAGRRHAVLADVPEPTERAAGFAHPSFWAPFVLIGW